MRKFLSGVLIAIVVFVSVYYIGDYIDTKRAEAQYEQQSQKRQEIADVYDEDNVDKSLYDILDEAVKTKKKKVVIKYDCTKEIFDTYTKLLSDHPEYFWVTRGSKYSTSLVDGKITVTFKPDYFMTKDEIKVASKTIDEVTEKVLLGVPQNATDYEKILYIHDYIVDNTVYDTKSAEENDGSGKKLSDDVYESASIYGCLVEGQAICTGYAATFQYFMDALGIESGRISGHTKGGDDVGHQWNYVKVEEDYYYIDLTWDDPVDEKGNPQECYEYFLVTESELEITHIFDDYSPRFGCTATKYNYFIYNNLYVNGNDMPRVKEIINTDFWDGETVIKFSSAAELQNAVKVLFEQGEVWKIGSVKGLKLKTIYHSISQNGLILRITTTE